MIDTDKYMYEEEAKKIVQGAGLIDECDGFLDVHYKSIAHLLAEVKQIHEILREAFSTEAKHSGAEYLNMIARVTGLIE